MITISHAYQVLKESGHSDGFCFKPSYIMCMPWEYQPDKDPRNIPVVMKVAWTEIFSPVQQNIHYLVKKKISLLRHFQIIN